MVTSRFVRVLLGVTLVMAVLCLLFTYSRGAFLGIIPSLGVLTGMLLFYLRREERRRYRRQLVLLTLLVLIPLALTLALDERLAERASSATKLETDVTVSNQARLVIWQGTWEMFQAKPLFGWGLGTFAIHFPQFRSSDHSRRGVSHHTQHAHCEYLEVAAELGVVGLVGFLLVLVLAFRQVHRALRTQESVKTRLLLIGCTCGILASLLHNLVSVNLRWTEPALTFWFVLGLMTRVGSVEYRVRSVERGMSKTRGTGGRKASHNLQSIPAVRTRHSAFSLASHFLLVITALLLSGIILGKTRGGMSLVASLLDLVCGELHKPLI